MALVQQVRKRVRKYREASREATGRVIGAGEHIISHFRKLNQERHKAGLRVSLFVKVLESGLDNVVHLGTGLILLLAAQSMRAGDFSVGDFALFTTYWYRFADFTDIFGGFLSAYQQARVSFERLIGLLKGELPEIAGSEVIDGLDPLKSIEIRNLSYFHPNSNCGIQNVSFEVKGGSFTVITGRIGSGKSTLLCVLLGQWDDKEDLSEAIRAALQQADQIIVLKALRIVQSLFLFNFRKTY